MNVAFYFPNKRIQEVNCSSIKNGNPGIGGTFYAILSLVYYLSSRNSDKNTYYLFANSISNLPMSINKVSVFSLDTLVDNIQEYKIDILVVGNGSKETLSKNLWEKLKTVSVDVILWAHCFMDVKTLNTYNQNTQIKRIVCVSKEQLHTYRDHAAFYKSSFIYNICDLKDWYFSNYAARANNVVYTGSLVPLKGFHILADIWNDVIKEIPDAKLFVIGGGNLYDRNSKLGQFHIAEYFYEKRILKNLLDKDNKIPKSVVFCGIMGEEKYEILKNAKVGVPNPSGKTETFGYTAIEMQLSGMLITTKKCPGYLETVMPNAGILYDNKKNLSANIIKLLKTTNYSYEGTKKDIFLKFSTETIVNEWVSLFEKINNKEKIDIVSFDSKLRISTLKELNRKKKIVLPFLPSLLFWEELISKISYFFDKLFHFHNTFKKIISRKIKDE